MKSFLTWSIFAKMNIIFILVFISIATNFLVIKHFRDKKFKQDRVIDIAGRNRMLSQRIAFLSEMIVQKKHVIKQDLADAIELKDKSLQTLLIGGVPPGRDSTIVFKAASDEVAAKIMEVQDIWKPFKTHALTILTNTDRDLSTAITYIENNQKILLTANNDLVLFIEHEHRKLNNKIRYILLPLFFISVLIIIGGVLIIRKYVILPITYLSEVASSMSRGHLETINFNKGKDEIGVLGKSLRKMTAVLRTTMLDIKSAAKQINEASSRMTENSILIAEGAEQEADASLIITDHVKTLSKVTKESTTKAYRTKDITAISLEKVNEGSKAFAQTMSAMKNIDKQILIVKDIAKQIDILAVNAAIEAARAGEAGRGFSVVASEVRKLADISKEASERIITITKEGVTLALVSQDLLHEIVPQIEESAQLVSEIATENTALSNQITEILSAIQELSNISVQNSAFSQSIAEISEQLTQHSQQLHDTTEFFKVYKSEKN